MNEMYLGANIPKLGFGFMRLPHSDDKDGSIDFEKTRVMVDRFMAAGFYYFDTAYAYNNGESERAIKETVVERYPRDAFWLTDKLPLWHVKKSEDMLSLFETSLKRCGVDYFDLYLLHSQDATSYEKAEKLGAWEFLKELKTQGRIKHIGFSFHDTADVLDKILSAHPETEMVQLQINYADWESDRIQSRACYETARKHGVPVLIMEPVKGGGLAIMPDDIRAKLLTANPHATPASWALRYAASLEGIVTVLSGMGDMSQLEDNLKTFQNFKPVDAQEAALLEEIAADLAALPTLPCTHCKYCVEGCPEKINIPEMIDILNKYTTFGSTVLCQHNYNWATQSGGTPGSCIECGACEEHCPQHLEIIDSMTKVDKLFG